VDYIHLKSSVFWDITPCSPLKVIQRDAGIMQSLLHTGFLRGLSFNPEDGGDIFLRKVG
jgi:hypothetical protein